VAAADEIELWGSLGISVDDGIQEGCLETFQSMSYQGYDGYSVQVFIHHNNNNMQ
jgi:hypothetical protein